MSVKETRRRTGRLWSRAGAVLATGLFACGGTGAQTEPHPQARWHNNQGVVYMDQHNYVKGRETFAAAVAIDRGYATAWANLGIAYYSLGKYDSARVALQEAITLDPEGLHANYTLGLIDHAQGRDYESARAAFHRVVARDADDPLGHYYLGRTYSKLGQADSAVAEFRRAIDLDADNVSAHYALAQELRQLGDVEAWRAELETFTRLNQAGLEGVSASYQGQGKYAEVVADGPFSRGATDRNAAFAFTAGDRLGTGAEPGGIVPVDADGDGDADLLVAAPGPVLFRNDDARLAPSDAWTFAGVGAVTGLALADVDDDGDLDAAWSGSSSGLLLQQDHGGGRFDVATAGPGGQAVATVFADADHDGDADLLTPGPALRMWRNDGSGQFADATEAAGLAGAAGGGTAAVFSDFDADRDVDFVLVGRGRQLYSNNRDGTFADVAGGRGLRGDPATGLAVADLVADGAMDLLVVAPGGADLYANAGSTFRRRPVAAPDGAEGAVLADLDNDGDLDVVWRGAAGVHLGVTVGDDVRLLDTALRSRPTAAVAALDVDGDGRLDLLAGDDLYWNRSDAGRHLDVTLAGLNSNPDGLGARVEVKTVASRQLQERRGGPGDPAVLHFGVGDADSVEFVRVLWPSGVRQTELDTLHVGRLAIREVNRKGTSCPILYAWDGDGYRFVSDFLGGAIIGYLTAPGQYYAPDTDEYLPVPALAPRDGRYVLQVANELEEVIYLDAAELVAVDHPAGTAAVPNERLLSAPPYPEFHPHVLTATRPLRGAVDGAGRDVGALLAQVDDRWYDAFAHGPVHGYAEDYVLVLDLGDLGGWEGDAALLANGWVDYAHSSSNWAAAQRGLTLSPPRLEAADGDGPWRPVAADMGCPAGLPKAMLFDLGDTFAPGARRGRLRISTNTPIYWDQFLVGRIDRGADPLVTRRPFASADLHWRGYSAHESIRGTFAFRYDYDRLQTTAPWGSHGGAFTRFGEVAGLVGAVDDRFAIMRHGDELTLQVAADAFPPVPAGWQRTFLFYADGFGKDMDFHSARSLTVEPLPFHGMSGYPYPPGEHYPTTEAHVRHVLDDNTRRVKGYYR